MGQIGFSETSVRNYKCAMRNIPDGRISNLLCSGGLKLRKFLFVTIHLWGIIKDTVMQYINISHFSLQYIPAFHESILITLSKVHAHRHLSWEPFGWNLHFGINHVELLLYAELCGVCDSENSDHVFLGYDAVQFGRWVILSWVLTASIFHRESGGNLLPRDFAA